MGHKLAAFRATSSRSDTDLYPELVWLMRLDALMTYGMFHTIEWGWRP